MTHEKYAETCMSDVFKTLSIIRVRKVENIEPKSINYMIDRLIQLRVEIECINLMKEVENGH